MLVAAGLLFLLAHALKAYGWGRLFTSAERPKPLALAAGNGGASLIGLVLPGRFDDAMRIAVVRRYPPCPVGVRGLCLSLVMLGLIDSAALAPLALAAAVLGGAGNGVRAGLAVIAVAGIAAAALIVVLPRLAGSRRTSRFRLGRWLSPRTTSLRRASQAWALVSACWLVRAVALFLLLGTLGVGYSFPLALLPLRRRGSGSAADRPGRHRDASRRPLCCPPRLGCRGLPGAERLGLPSEPLESSLEPRSLSLRLRGEWACHSFLRAPPSRENRRTESLLRCFGAWALRGSR